MGESAPQLTEPGERASVSFPELVRAHFVWREQLEQDGEGLAAANAEYCRLLERFEDEHGKIVNSYWCSNVQSAVALTAKSRPFGRPEFAFHRVSDWATKGEPDIAQQLHRCDEIAVRARVVLTGLRRNVCLELVTASAAHLLSLVDARAAHEDEERTRLAVAVEKERLDDAYDYYCDAANGQAQMVYVLAMAGAAALIAVLTLFGALFLALPDVDQRELYGTLIAGAIGAVISVVQRVTSGKFRLDFDVGRPYLVFLGGLRPVVGAVFGLALYFAMASAIVPLTPTPTEGTARFYAFVVIAFVAGFSERWAQDTLVAAAAPAIGKAPAVEEEEFRKVTEATARPKPIV